jgi:hypothetical protein
MVFLSCTVPEISVKIPITVVYVLKVFLGDELFLVEQVQNRGSKPASASWKKQLPNTAGTVHSKHLFKENHNYVRWRKRTAPRPGHRRSPT